VYPTGSSVIIEGAKTIERYLCIHKDVQAEMMRLSSLVSVGVNHRNFQFVYQTNGIDTSFAIIKTVVFPFKGQSNSRYLL
jgi:hypothetical protein